MEGKRLKGYRHLPAFVLLAVAREPGHGAAVWARLREMLPVQGVDSGAIYRTLAALEAAGEVAGAWDTTGRGPASKVYTLTEAGWERLDFWRQDIAYRMRLLAAFLDAAREARANRPGGPA